MTALLPRRAARSAAMDPAEAAALAELGIHRDPATPDPLGSATFSQRLVHRASGLFSKGTTRRSFLTRTAVLKGVGLPSDDQVPSICSQGGLGTNFHGLLIPTIAGISGPWSLWAPVFGEDAIDFDHLRDQVLAFGDIAIELDDVPLEEIAGDYPAMREERAAGATTCDLTPPPAVAPTP